MQLKKIILKGFKSFPDKTVLEFDDGITAIVGPNGSGKSNVIEAIRWVMGEQSAKTLRGNRMEDVIFSGTRERNAVNIAEVELILDNSQGYLDLNYEEISIVRRLSRTKGSTYMINKQECRLKDIIDLFMDSGLGKESFSVISQGEVEAIFNSKPEDRRGIFEEAAGVFKYKVRKEEAEKKLEQTEDNLDRVQDILYELESQLEPLKKQADIAESYLEHREKLTDLDIALSVHQIKNLSQEIKKDQEEHKQLLAESTQIEDEITTHENQKEKIQMTLEESRKTAEKLNEKFVEVVREKERLESALRLFDEKSKHRTEFIDEKNRAIQELNIRSEEYTRELKVLNEHHAELEKQLAKVTQAIQKLESRRTYLEGDKSLHMEELRSEYIESLQKQTNLKNESSYLEQELARTQIEKRKFQEQTNRLRMKVEEHNKLLTTKEQQYELISQELKQQFNTYQKEAELLEKSKEQTEQLTKELTQNTNELERMKAKAISLKEMQENYAGYYAGVRAVMKEKHRLNGIVGTVAELIKIPEKYLSAINTVLTSSGQFIIVENEKNGRDAIRYLKETKNGRATFLPLTTIQPREISSYQIEKIQQVSGYLGIGSSLVTNDASIQNVVDNLLGQTIVAETLEAANKIARLLQFRHRVVSLEGDVINAGGSMTGGGRQSNLNPIFSQRAELERLEKYIEENQTKLIDLSEKQQTFVQTTKELEEKLEETRLTGEKKRLTEQQIKSERTNLQEEYHRFSRELEAITFELKEKNTLLLEYEKQLHESKKSLERVEEQVSQSKKDMQLLSSEQENINVEREKVTQEIERIQEKRNTIREKIATSKVQIKNHAQQIEEFNKQIIKLQEDIQSFDTEVGVTSKKELNEEFLKYSQQEQKIQEKQHLVRIDIQQISQENEELTQKIQQLNGRYKFLNEAKGKIEINISKNDVRVDYLLDYLVEEYKVSFEEARLFNQTDINFNKAKKEVKLLKKGIDELGPVNLNAIEEFKSVNDRYQFLSEQQKDLIDAKENLFNTMGEMDLIVEKHFKRTFNQVKKEFSKVFPKMFGGGHAELVLSDPDNLLETGIEIIAQPPGKKLTRLSLLSGGERALTAISLLFSIIQVNPIPFVILDEAEAALDDANVVRFGQYLQKFEDDTQFIVITHRKGTMEHSDQLYGITMQEQGISKIVGVSLKEAETIEGVI